jgi:Animal haem peroxidase
MENPELTAVTILFMREHNLWVGKLKAQHPSWTGAQRYDMAKAITTAEYQNIIYTEYLPLLIGPVLSQYKSYNPRINAQVTQEFSTAAFRVGHSQISDTQEGLDSRGNVTFEESLAQAFFNTPAEDEANGFNPLLRSLGVDFAQATDGRRFSKSDFPGDYCSPVPSPKGWRPLFLVEPEIRSADGRNDIANNSCRHPKAEYGHFLSPGKRLHCGASAKSCLPVSKVNNHGRKGVPFIIQ